MKRIKCLYRRDRSGLVRGTLALGVTLVLIVLLLLWALNGRNSTRVEERAADAARQVAQQFQLLVEDGFRQMNVVSGEISGDDAGNLVLISNMVRYGVFSDAMLISDGVEQHLDGTKAQAAAPATYIHYHTEALEGKIIGETDGTMQLRVSAGEGVELAAWLDSDRLDKILGSAFEQEYGYVIFNATTGAYLINRGPYAGGGYYDALLRLNARGGTEKLLSAEVAQAHIRNGAESGIDMYIAQTDTAIHPWSIALFIPEDVLTREADAPRPLVLVSIVSALLLVSALTVNATFLARRLKAETSDQQRKAHISEKLLALSARDAKAMLYIYQRKEDRIRTYYDGLMLDGSGSAAPKTLLELAESCSVAASDVEQLRERAWDLKPGERCDLNLICTAQGSKHLLRFALSCPEDEGELILGTVRDFTVEQQAKIRFGEESNFRKLILPKTISIWQFNLSRGRWKLTDCRPDVNLNRIGIVLDEWRDYETDINAFVRNYLYPKDYQEYVSNMNPEEILDMYRKGKAEQILEYRIRSDKDDSYAWHRHVLRVFKDPESGDVLASMYVLNVDAEKNAEIERKARTRILQQTLTALGGIYDGLYYVDLDGDLCYAARTHGNELITQLSMPFKSTFADYIAQNVHPDDQEALRKLLDPYIIRKSIREGSHFLRCEYRRGIGDGYEWSAAIVQAARFENGTVREVVIALRNINAEK